MAAEKLLFLINEQVDGVTQSESAAFSIIELMGSSQQLSVKQISYLIAPFLLKRISQIESNESTLLTLTPNIFLKDLKNLHGDCAIPSISLNCLSQIIESELT